MTDLIDHIEEVNRQVDGLSESNNKIVENISPVSYTHLDVYKRQVERRMSESRVRENLMHGLMRGG